MGYHQAERHLLAGHLWVNHPVSSLGCGKAKLTCGLDVLAREKRNLVLEHCGVGTEPQARKVLEFQAQTAQSETKKSGQPSAVCLSFSHSATDSHTSQY